MLTILNQNAQVSEQQLSNQADKINSNALTNGSLVRFLPLAIWGTKTKIGKEKQIRDILELDAKLTHPSPLVHDA